jgi:hypothetical protein
MKEILWIVLCASLFTLVAAAWIQRLGMVVVEGAASSNTVSQPDAAASKDHSKNITSVEKVLDDLDAILIPILNQVTKQNQVIKIVVNKEPKSSYTSPDITLTMDHPDDVMPTMHITLPQGETGVTGPTGPSGPVGAPGEQGPRGLSGGK